MFGGSSNTGWGTNNQQQPAQTGTAFGQPATGFGSGGAFTGGGSAFGSTSTQQPANPMFGGNNASTSTFGSGFGTNNNAQQTSAFGAPKPATGFGAFGGGGGTGGSTFGGGGGFGTNNATTTTGSAFGGGGGTSAFGQPSTSAFGAPATAAAAIAPVTNGTGGPPFQAFQEKDGNSSNTMLQYQSITAMEHYRGSCFEELRVQDYMQGRKTASTATGGAFGQTSAFGAPANTGSNMFGQQSNAAQPTGSIFGGGGTSAFGNTNQPAGTGTFGSTGSAFGQPAATNTNTGSGIFGASTGSAFGQPQAQQQQTTGFGAFGQPQQQAAPATGTSIFGGGSAFGTQQNKPATGFGALGSTNPAGGAFGASGNTGGLFGSTNTNQQQSIGGVFGQPQAQPTTGAFGSTFGATNNNAAPKTGIFGQPAQPAAGTTGGSIFGGGSAFSNTQNNQQQNQQQPGGLFGGGGGLFGNSQQQNQQPQQPAGGLFGNTANNQQQQTGGGLFGGGGGGLFGNSQQQNQQQNQGGLFGAKPTNPAAPTGGLFGSLGATANTTTTGQQPGGLFGNNTLGQQPQPQQQTGGLFGGSSLFGNKTAAPAAQATSGGLFGGSTLGGSTAFNGSNSNASQVGTLTASVNQPIAANLPIFTLLSSGPQAVSLDHSPKKKPAFIVDVLTRTPVPRVNLGASGTAKLRGFSSHSQTASTNSPFSFSKSSAGVLSLDRSESRTPGPDDFFSSGRGSPALGSSGRSGVKKLVLDKKTEPANLFDKPGGAKDSNKITFNPALSIAAREHEATAQNGASRSSPAPAPPASNYSPNRFTAKGPVSFIDPSNSGKSTGPDIDELQDGDYYVKPPLSTLKTLSHEELSSFNDLVVGRVGYGEIHFLEPVDLTGLPKLSALLGDVVFFDNKECTVYPSTDEADKPQPGQGLNVPARISLDKCWQVNKATREPIKDEKDPAHVKWLKRLHSMKGTYFESYELEAGKWTFKVDHF